MPLVTIEVQYAYQEQKKHFEEDDMPEVKELVIPIVPPMRFKADGQVRIRLVADKKGK